MTREYRQRFGRGHPRLGAAKLRLSAKVTRAPLRLQAADLDITLTHEELAKLDQLVVHGDKPY